MKCALATRNTQENEKFYNRQAARRSAAHLFNFKKKN